MSAPNCNCFSNPDDITNGLPVDQQTLQPVLESLYKNDLYLKSLLDYFEAPSALIKCVECNPNVAIGMPMYFSTSTGRYEKAQFGNQPITGSRIILNETAEVFGLCVKKPTSDSAVMLIDGIYAVDLTASTGSATGDGKLYLGTTAGTLVTVPSNDMAPVYVCTAMPDGFVLFRPYSGEFGSIILQWKHKLTAAAAGTISSNGTKLSITSPNTNLPGWLPAGSLANAPVGAIFGYNIAADATLAGKWPLKYISSAYIDMDRGLTADVGATGVTLGSGGMCQIDNNGIWWFSDCIVDCPFDVTVRTPGSPGTCPRTLFKTVTLYAARPAGGGLGEAGSVTSLKSTHAAIKVRKRDTLNTAETGNLDLSLDVPSLLGPLTDSYEFAVKRHADGKLVSGPVVTGLKVSGTGLSLSGTTNNVNASTHGLVTLSLSGATSRELMPLTVSLARAEEESFNGTIAIGLPAGRDSSFRSQFVVPLNAQANSNAKIRLWVMAKFNGGTLTAANESLVAKYRVIAQPTTFTDTLLTSDTTITIPSCTINHGKAYEITSNAFVVNPGDLVYVDIARTPGAAVYELHVLKQFIYLDDPTTTTTTTTSTTSTTTAAP